MKLQPIISHCGLDCSDCPAFLAHKFNNQKLRVKTAKTWAKLFNDATIKPEDINCLGCLSKKQPIYKHCLECGVRLCGEKKGIKNCGQCAEYNACPKISSLHQFIPEAKATCDKINAKKK